jgi:hypothetical protein
MTKGQKVSKRTMEPISLDELDLENQTKEIQECVYENWKTQHQFIKESIDMFFDGILGGTNDWLELVDRDIMKHAWFQGDSRYGVRTTSAELKFAQKYLAAFGPKVSKIVERLGLDERKGKVIARIASETGLAQSKLISEAVNWLANSAMNPLNAWFAPCSNDIKWHRAAGHKDSHLRLAVAAQ